MNPSQQADPRQLDVQAVRAACVQATPPILVDVREPWEFAQGALPEALHLPLGTIPSEATPAISALTTATGTVLPQGRAIVTYCHHGVRSFEAARRLMRLGYTDVASMAGGIDAWSVHIDDRVARY